jgi:DNA-binding transcriptional ArsR family regulator
MSTKTQMADRLSITFAALSDPTRRAILARLAQGEASVGELARPFALSLPTVSRHLKVLEQANLIARRTDAQWRRCRISAEPLHEAADWIERYRAFWEARFDALAHYLTAMPDEPASKRRRGRPRRARRARASS